MNSDEVVGNAAVEFPISFGFTRDPERVGPETLEFRGVMKVWPRVIGIYRTGDSYAAPLVLMRIILHIFFRNSWRAEKMVLPDSADVAPNTDGTPEHLIDTRRLTLLHDEERRLFILQVPGTRHFAVRARRDGLTPAAEVERKLLAALERCARAKVAPVHCCRDAFAVAAIAVLLGAIGLVVLWFLSIVFRW